MYNWEKKSPSGKLKSPMDQVITSNEIEYEDSWSWGGCSDDPGQAEKTTKALFASFESETDAHAFAEKHNNLIGQRVSEIFGYYNL